MSPALFAEINKELGKREAASRYGRGEYKPVEVVETSDEAKARVAEEIKAKE